MRRDEMERAVWAWVLPGERLVWVGQPSPWRVFTGYNLLFLLYGLPALAFLWWLIFYPLLQPGAWQRDPTSCVFALLFLLGGIYIVFIRIIIAFLHRQRTVYAVTDHRILVRSGVFAPHVEARALAGLPALQPDEYPEQRGTLLLEAPAFAELGWWVHPRLREQHELLGLRNDPLQFADIPRPREVALLIQRLRAAPTNPEHIPPPPWLPDPDLSAQLLPILPWGEALEWTGRPDPRRLMTPYDIPVLLFLLLWMGLPASALLIAMLEQRWADLLAPWWIFVILGGLYLYGRFWVQYVRRTRQRYALTNRALYFLNGETINRVPLATLSPARVGLSADGSGTIRFGPWPGYFAMHEENWFAVQASRRAGWFNRHRLPPPPTLHSIPDTAQLAHRIETLRGVPARVGR